jgi:hypothetical protein
MRPRQLAQRVGPAVVALGLVACGGGGGDTADPTAATFETVVPTEPLFTRTTDETTSGSGSSGPDATADPSTSAATEPGDSGGTGDTGAGTEPPAGSAGTAPATSLSTVPDTGVPGLDSADAFCRAWSQFAGSFQALAGVSALGEPEDAARTEVAASGAVVAAVEDLDANLPAELEAERVGMMELTSGMGARAAAARDELLAAGLSQEDVDALGEAWLEALTAAGIDDPTVAVDVPAGVDGAAFDAAVASFLAAKPALVDDPSMFNEAEVPLTDEYLIENCPDQGTLAGNDEVGG